MTDPKLRINPNLKINPNLPKRLSEIFNMKKIALILMVSMVTAAPLSSFAQNTGVFAETAAAIAESQSRAMDAFGVPIKSEGVAKIAGAAAGTKSQTVYSWIETFVRTTLKKALLDKLVDQIIGSIQGNGEPQFVTDWQGLLEDAGQTAAGEFAQQLGLGFLCSPFSLQIQASFLPVPSFSQSAQCTLDKIVGNIQNFYDDFRNGGWIAYGAAWQPQNNFFGAHLIASQELNSLIEKKVGAKLNEALAGGGFLSTKDKNGNIITPGSTAKDLVSKVVTSDIDFLFTAEQLQDYASAIANAISNRVLKEGITGLKNLTSQSSQNAAVSHYNAAVAQNFNSLKNTLLSQISQVIVPREDTTTIIDSAIQLLNQYKSVLQTLSSNFTATGKNFCPPVSGQPFGTQTVNVSQVQQQITAEISQANNTIADFQNQKLNNQAVINLLLAKQPEIEGLQPDNTGLTQLQAINDQIAALVDVAGAENFKSAMQTQYNAINQNINQKLSTFNQQLQQCQLSP